MPLYRLTLAYDGAEFSGWQAQGPGGPRTVQGVLEAALQRLAGAPVRVAGAGRTDAGAHALGQVASFELPRDWRPDALQRALNALLPADVRALHAAPAPAGFHARRSAVAKHYRYELDSGPVQSPLRRRYAGHVAFALDASAVREAGRAFVGRHDFASLQSAGGSVKTSVRTITRSEARLEAGTLVYEVVADGFLRQMVRSIVGGLVEVGRGAWRIEDLRAALARHDRRGWPAPAEARGLVLVSVAYPGETTGVR